MDPSGARSIRRARAADAGRLTAIAHAAKAFWGYSSSDMALWRVDLTVTPESIEEDDYRCLDDGQLVVAFYALSDAGLDDAGRVVELEHMWVEPAAMHHGHGAALFHHALDVARAAGASTLRIVSDPHAEGFYTRMGAERIGAVPSRPDGRTLPLLVVRLAGDDPMDRRRGSAYGER